MNMNFWSIPSGNAAMCIRRFVKPYQSLKGGVCYESFEVSLSVPAGGAAAGATNGLVS
jgi:hypothetical protein